MSGGLRRVMMWIRLALVCAALVGTSAPAPAIVHAEVAMFVASAEVLAVTPPVVEADTVALPAPCAGEAARAPESVEVAPDRPDGPKRRLFVLHCALLC